MRAAVQALQIRSLLGPAWAKIFSLGPTGKILGEFEVGLDGNQTPGIRMQALQVPDAICIVIVQRDLISELQGWVEMVDESDVIDHFVMSPNLSWSKVSASTAQQFARRFGGEEEQET